MQQKKHSLLANKQRGNAGPGKFNQSGAAATKPSPRSNGANTKPNRTKFDSALSNLKERSKMNAKSQSDKIINAGLILQQSILSPTVTSLPQEMTSVIDQLLHDEETLNDKSGIQMPGTQNISSMPLTNMYAVLDEDYRSVKPLILQPSILAQSQTLFTLQNKSNHNNLIREYDI